MTQIYKDPSTGQEHEFPDDATPQEIDAATRGQSAQMQQMQPQQKLSPMERVMNEIGGFNEKFKNYIVDPALGFVQGTANALPGALNLGKHFIENRNPVIQKLKEQNKYNLPDVPYFDIASHTLPAQAGEAASMVAGSAPLLKGGSLALEKGLGNIINSAKSISKTGLKNTVLNAHDALDASAINKFNHVSSEVKSRNIGNFPQIPKLNKNLSEYFPRTNAAKKLLNDAQSGDYDALRKVQSDLYTNGKKNLSSDLESERLRGHEMIEKRDDINKFISDNLKKTGHEDLSNTLDSARADWKKLNDIYYNNKMNRAVIKMVDQNHRLIPKNIARVLNEDSKPMQEFRDFHPGLDKAINAHMKLSNIEKKIKKYAIPSALGAVGGYGAYKYMKD